MAYPALSQRLEKIKFLTTDELRRLLSTIKDKRDRAPVFACLPPRPQSFRSWTPAPCRCGSKDPEGDGSPIKGSHSGVHPLQPDEAKALKAVVLQIAAREQSGENFLITNQRRRR
jgi:hypothetical protein